MSKDEESTRTERGSTFTGIAIVGTEVLVGFVRCQCPLRDSRAWHQIPVVKMVYKNKPRGKQLTKVLLPPPPWRSLAFLASGVPDTGLALSLERHAYHVTAWALVNGNEAAGRAGTSWDRGQVPPSACVPSPKVLTLSGANLNSLTCSAKWRRQCGLGSSVPPWLLLQLTGWRPSRKAPPGWGRTTWPSYMLLLTWGIHGLAAKWRQV